MQMPRIDGTVTIGNILLIATIVIGFVVNWTEINTDSGHNREAINVVSTDVSELEVRVRSLEVIVPSYNVQLTAINSSLQELKADVRSLVKEADSDKRK